MAWNKLETAGPSPIARQGHASCVVGHNLIIQGGFSFNESKYKKSLDNYGTFLKNCYLNDIKLLDLKDNTWVQLRTNGQPPTARFGHTLSFVNNQLIIFGGWSCHSGRRFNAISGNSENEFVEETDYFYSLDTSNLVWSKSTFGGDLPSNRYGHSATVFRHNILYFGGWSCHSGRRFNAISGNSENEFVAETDYFYSLDTSNLVWSKSTFGGDLPSNRYGHSATVFRHNILDFGGWEFGKALNDINILLAK